MNNPFDDLRNQSNLDQTKAIKEAQQILERQRQEEAYKVNVFKQLSPMVTRILRQLGEVMYPGYELRGDPTNFSWLIVMDETGQSYDALERIITKVCVYLSFDKQWHSYFVCRIGEGKQSREVNTPSTESNLISTLHKLHKFNNRR